MRIRLLIAGFVLTTVGACDGHDGVWRPPDAAWVATDDCLNPLTCNPLGPPGQQGCAVGEKCTWIRVAETPEPLGRVDCVPDGAVALGGACSFTTTEGGGGGDCEPLRDQTGYDDCAAGLYCSDGVCTDICGFDGSANAMCASGEHCTRYVDTFANGDDDPIAGLCNRGCDPLTQTITGTVPPESCGEGKGCYVLVSQTDSIAVCARAGTVMAGQEITGRQYANSCVPGAQPRAKERGSQTVECGGLCRVVDVTSSLNGASEGGEATTASATDIDSCQDTWGALPPGDGVGGESCRYWWAREPFDTLSRFSNSLGWCYKHAAFQYDSNGDLQDDRPFPRCTSLTTGDVEPPIGNPPHNDALYFWCVAAPPPMLAGAMSSIKRQHARFEPRLDRLVEPRHPR